MDRELDILNKFGHGEPDDKIVIKKTDFIEAMREFARERSIGFKIWSDIHGWDINPESGNQYTTDQLYTKYLESLNNK